MSRHTSPVIIASEMLEPEVLISTNQVVNELREQLDPFEYDVDCDTIEAQLGQREFRPKTDLGNGKYYLGEWLKNTTHSNIREGRGTYLWPDGQIYEGFWKNNKAQFRGRFIIANGGFYEGEIKDNMRHGKGEEIWPDGAMFEGQFQNNEQHGFGKFTWPNDETYEGEY